MAVNQKVWWTARKAKKNTLHHDDAAPGVEPGLAAWICREDNSYWTEPCTLRPLPPSSLNPHKWYFFRPFAVNFRQPPQALSTTAPFKSNYVLSPDLDHL